METSSPMALVHQQTTCSASRLMATLLVIEPGPDDGKPN